MEHEGVIIREIDEIPVLIIKKHIVNPFSDRFVKNYLEGKVTDSDACYKKIQDYFITRSKEHYSKQSIIEINKNLRISEVDEKKLYVCKLCYNYCSINQLNDHFKKKHQLTKNFNDAKVQTTGYVIPSLSGYSYLYHNTDISDNVKRRKLNKTHVLKKSENYRQSLKDVHGSMNPYLTQEIYDIGDQMYGHLFNFNKLHAKAAMDAVTYVDNILLVGPTGSTKNKIYHVPMVFEKLEKKLPFVTIVLSPSGFFFS